MTILDKIKKIFNKDKVLVISWWGFRWMYALWVLKWLEELWIDKEIKAVFWVSIWAIIWSLRTSWMTADKIFEKFNELSLNNFYWKEIFTKTWWVLSNKKIKEMINIYIPKNFTETQKKLYIWVVDTKKAQYKLFDSGDLREIVLGSMSIPWIFPPVKYKDYILVDWWVLNNFPVDLAKEKYPKNKIIWIALNKFKEDQKISTSRDNLWICFNVIMKSQILKTKHLADYLFYPDIPVPTLSLNKWKLENAFNMWYKDCIKMFWK